MGWVALRQRRWTLRSENVDAARLIDTVRIRVIPGPFPQRDNARHHTRSHFSFDMHFTTSVEDTYAIAITNAARFRIHRVDPHLLSAGRFQYVNVAVGGVNTRFVVETSQLKREFLRQRIVVVFEAWRINRQRIDNVPSGNSHVAAIFASSSE